MRERLRARGLFGDALANGRSGSCLYGRGVATAAGDALRAATECRSPAAGFQRGAVGREWRRGLLAGPSSWEQRAAVRVGGGRTFFENLPLARAAL